MKKNPFSVLGVPDTASDEQIRNAYRELARKYSDSSDDGKMQELNDAYDQIVMLRGGLGGSSLIVFALLVLCGQYVRSVRYT